ncbi:MAG: CoA transferase subunit A [Clostridia bacterium]|nr:CoA transferase subunit A [Clostridia bacterium]
MRKITTAKDAVSRIKSGDVVMVGGFLQGGSPERILEALLSDSSATDLTIVNNDTGFDTMNTYKLMEAGRVSKVYATWIGGNSITGSMYLNQPGSVTLVPQGTLAERIRAAGMGIPEFLTPTGVGTIAAEGKESKVIDGKEYLVEKALHGDVAIVHATVADEFGNCYMRGATKNFNALMPAACQYCIVEAEKIVPVGEIDPDLVTVSGIYVDAVVQL